MKKRYARPVSAVLAVLILSSVFALAACGQTGDVMLKLGKAEITENMFVFWLSRYKAQFIYGYSSSLKQAYGVSSVDAFWELTDPESGKTYDDVFTEFIYQNALTYLTALDLCNELGISLSEEEEKKTEETIDSLKSELAEGSKTEFNAILAGYGLNIATLRRCYNTEKLVYKLQKTLFGAGGPEEITAETVEKYYRDNYQRMRQICIFINKCPEKGDSGEYLTDSEGKVAYRDMSAAETTAARERASDALARLTAGADFDEVAATYNENTASAAYKNGIYLSEEQVYRAGDGTEKLFDALCEMKAGEIRLVELENTLHVIQKLELDEGAYDKAENSDFFSFYDSSSGGYVSLKDYIITPLFLDYIEKRQSVVKDRIECRDEVREKHKISQVAANSIF